MNLLFRTSVIFKRVLNSRGFLNMETSEVPGPSEAPLILGTPHCASLKQLEFCRRASFGHKWCSSAAEQYVPFTGYKCLERVNELHDGRMQVHILSAWNFSSLHQQSLLTWALKLWGEAFSHFPSFLSLALLEPQRWHQCSFFHMVSCVKHTADSNWGRINKAPLT